MCLFYFFNGILFCISGDIETHFISMYDVEFRVVLIPFLMATIRRFAMNILNLTQHVASNEQISEGVYEPDNKKEVQHLLTFNSLPTEGDLKKNAMLLARIAREEKATHAMIGGAPFFMSSLEEALRNVNIIPLYAFSVRESVEEVLEDGSTRKVNVFRHKGFVGL